MNSFESDCKRAVCSVGFIVGLLAQVVILLTCSTDSVLYTISVPIVCTLPFSCGFLEEYKNGFVRFSLSRSSYPAYIISKFLAAGVSGGLLEVLAAWVYRRFCDGEPPAAHDALLFLSGMLWASVAILFAAISRSRYLAYGGSFVISYFLIILYERYWKTLYCLNPTEWYQPTHVWPFDDTGILLLVGGVILILFFSYYQIVRRLLEHA